MCTITAYMCLPCDRKHYIIYTHMCTITTYMCVLRAYRDPITGYTHPRLQSVLKMTHLTAERRVRAIFYWAHVLGTDTSVMNENCRLQSQVAVAALQILLIATRGHRSYTVDELNFIFDEIGRQFFTSLEHLALLLDRTRMRNQQRHYEQQPERGRPPQPFRKQKRYVYKHTHV